MASLTEIRWHGRGGQGAKTAALLLADVAFQTGKHVQGFPEYGPERMGAPITAYDRISDQEIRVHSNIYEPDYVAVVDDTLLHCVDVTGGLKESGGILINTDKTKEELLPLLSLERRVKSSTPPTFIWHTADDTVVDLENTLLFETALRARGVPVECHIYPHGAHGQSLADRTCFQPEELWKVSVPCAGWVAKCDAWIQNTFMR